MSLEKAAKSKGSNAKAVGIGFKGELKVDLGRKSLGLQGAVPSQCPICGEMMCRQGWAMWGHRVTCYACRCSFENFQISVIDEPSPF